jgi:hypothetical protein
VKLHGIDNSLKLPIKYGAEFGNFNRTGQSGGPFLVTPYTVVQTLTTNMIIVSIKTAGYIGHAL